VAKKKSITKDQAKLRQGSATQPVAHFSDKQVRDALGRELLGVCMATLRTYGLRNSRIAELAAEAAAAITGEICSATEVLADAQRLADSMNKWVEDPAYRDITGRPAVLSVRDSGGHCFAALAREFFPERTVGEVVKLGCEANVLERVGPDKVALINSTVLFTGNSLPILAYSIRTVQRFLCTAEFNRRVSAAVPGGWPDRTSFVEVSEDDFQEFVRVFRPQISGLIEMSNRWLFQRSKLSRNRLKKKRIAGIQVFVFRE
jgi:hypothetical protein